ncbi:MAG: hypothetical protein GVY24_06225 [Planctomycetes bacterium]|jgi:DNA-binding CsgD family transcriptional regulator|nr:hypothetical protein [Planctomycetota bacterium]
MSSLTRRDYEKVVRTTAQWHALRSADELIEAVTRDCLALIDADRVSFEHFVPTVPDFSIMAATPAWEVDFDSLAPVLLDHLHEHPCIQHHLRTGDPTALKISDFLSTRQFHRTELYRRLYRRLECEDQFGMTINQSTGPFSALVAYRVRRGYTERDRAILNCVRPHAARAYANVQWLAHARDVTRTWRRFADLLGLATLEADRAGRIHNASQRAGEWIERFFGRADQPARLPAELRRWLRSRWPRLASDGQAANHAPLSTDRDGDRLLVRLMPAATAAGDRATLVMELQRTESLARAAHSMGLTAAQQRVVAELARGRTNRQIAAALTISPHTVRKHLENVYDRLGVDNRAAALAALHRRQP